MTRLCPDCWQAIRLLSPVTRHSLTEEALEQMALITMDNAKAFLEGAELVNEVK